MDQLLKRIFLLLSLLLITGCQIGEASPPGPTSTPEPTPTIPPLALDVDVEDTSIRVAIPIEPPSFNAYLNDTGYEALVGELVYGALVEIGPDGDYYPELAQEVPTLLNGGLSEDGLTVTWKLRPGTLWSDGEPFTSNDVRFTWQALRDSGIWAPGFDLIEDVETPDDLTAIVRYSQFYPNYIIQFGGRGTGVLPQHHCGATNEMLFWDCNLEPVSTGPFVLSQWVTGVRLTFEPNPNYYVAERPLAEQLVVEIQPDPEFRERSLTRGVIHLDIWPEEPAITRILDSGAGAVLWTDPARFVLRLVLNLSGSNQDNPEAPHPILGDLQIRRAIRHAIEPGRINAEAYDDRGKVVETELFQLGCDIPPPLHYNPGLAQALLDDAGWVLENPEEETIRRCRGCGTVEDGTPLVLESYTYLEAGRNLEEAHRLIEEMLAEVGVKLERRVVEGGQLWDTWQNEGIELRGQFDMNLWDDGYFGVDPTIYMTDYFDPRGIPSRTNPVAGLNVSRYYNAELIDLFDALHQPLPNSRRRALLCELAITLDQDIPYIPLLAVPDPYAVSVDLHGVVPHIYDVITWNAADWQLVRPLDN